MHIDSKKLNEVAALMEDHGLTRVRLSEEDGRVVELERMTAPAPEAIAVPVAAPMTAAVTPAAAPAAPAVTGCPRCPSGHRAYRGAGTCCRNRTGPYRL
ncbi:acetyl-CoA carboxylase biotin carboxyl carrier protein [Collinsella sp. CAG:398]|nr:acetyl-CoA carboxylase biotin carboxyl carrier protein [Collinsella sp. CAG:398]